MFRFQKPGLLRDGDLLLRLHKKTPAAPVKKYVPAYEFHMFRPGGKRVMGVLHLRIGSARVLRYPGHIGYKVGSRFRGHGLAARACRLILPLARAHGLKAVWLSVRPGNAASCKTCENLGAEYMGTVRLPAGHEMCRRCCTGHMRRYRLNVPKSA